MLHSRGLSQCVAVCCGVLPCVAGCCRVLQCAAVCCSVAQCPVVCCRELQCFAVCCSVLQHIPPRARLFWFIVVCCSVLQCVAVWCSTSLLEQNSGFIVSRASRCMESTCFVLNARQHIIPSVEVPVIKTVQDTSTN